MLGIILEHLYNLIKDGKSDFNETVYKNDGYLLDLIIKDSKMVLDLSDLHKELINEIIKKTKNNEIDDYIKDILI